MSYTIFKRLKQNVDGTFTVECAESNVLSCDNKLVFEKCTVTPFSRFDKLSNLQRRVSFILNSHWSGDKFYPKNWRDDLRLASRFFTAKSINLSTWIKIRSDENDLIKLCNEFIEFKRNNTAASKNYIVVFKTRGEYIFKFNKTSVKLTMDKDRAKVFKMEYTDLQNKLLGYKQYNPEIIEA